MGSIPQKSSLEKQQLCAERSCVDEVRVVRSVSVVKEVQLVTSQVLVHEPLWVAPCLSALVCVVPCPECCFHASRCLLPPLFQSLIVRSQLDLWPFSLTASFVSSLPGYTFFPSTYYYQLCGSCTNVSVCLCCRDVTKLYKGRDFCLFYSLVQPQCVELGLASCTQKILFSDCGSEKLISQGMATVNLKSSFLI